MANLLQKTLARSTWPSISLDDYASFFQFGGTNYPFGFSQTMSGHVEEPNGISFEGFVHTAYRSNGVVFACMTTRQLTFSEARFQFRQRTHGRPGDLFGNQNLAVLETPWPNGTTADLLSRMIQDVDLAGNAFNIRRGNKIRRLRPDWVTIILGSYDDPKIEAGDIDAEVVGYLYHPGGRMSGRDPVLLLPDQVSHWAPLPDPGASFRGISWLTPIIREFMSDTAMMVHKQKFFENGATPNMVVTLEPNIRKEVFKEWVQMFSESYQGALNAYKTLYLGAGATVTPVGKDFRQMDFAVTQAAGETRIAAAAGVPAVIVGLSEGLAAATYSNYAQARRRFADMTMRPLWRSAAGALAKLVRVPNSAELWYDDRDIPFLDEDVKDRAEVQKMQTASIRQLIDAGFEADTVIKAVTSGDFTFLKHTGLYSVQLQPPMTKNQLEAGPTPPTTPAPEPKPEKKKTEKKSFTPANAEQLFARMLADDKRDAPTQLPAPSVEVHAHFPERMVQVDSPITVEGTTISEGAFRAEAPQITIEAPQITVEGTTFADGSIRVDAPTTIEEGAFRAGDVTVESPEFELRDGAIHVVTNIQEGAVRVEAPITVQPAELRMEDGAIRVDAGTTIEAGAVQVDAPVTVERTEVHVDEGAINVPVTVERTEVHVDEGAVRVEAPVTVERTEIHVDEGAVRLEAPITVERTEVHVDPGAVVVPVTVERTEVHIDEGAVRVDAPVTVERTEVHIDEGAVNVPVTVERTEVHIDEGAVRVDAPVTIEEGAVRMEAPITVERTEVNVAPTELRIEPGAIQVDARTEIAEGAVQVDAPVTIDRGAVEVQVDAPVTIERDAVNVQVDAPEVQVPEVDTRGIETAVEELRDKVDKLSEPKRKRIIRDGDGRITDVVDVVENEETEGS